MGDALCREESTHLLVLFQHENWEIVQFNSELQNIYVIHRCDRGHCLVSLDWKSSTLEKECWGCHEPVPNEITAIKELHRV